MNSLSQQEKNPSIAQDAVNLHYLNLLSKQYPTIRAASTEIINLKAHLYLPKGTEHFISDIHGEYEAFLHVLKNGSGSIRRKIDEIFANDLSESSKRTLATLVYYPEQKLPLVLTQIQNENEWFRLTLFRLIRLARVTSSKYTRSKVREALPQAFAETIEELLHQQESINNRHEYYQMIIDTIISTGQAKAVITALAKFIQLLSIAHLHIIGDVFDRGPGAHIIMDTLMDYHSLDFQWGNHDIVWMGAAAGSGACIANVIRVSLRYSNTETLENGYGISLIPLASFAMDIYGDDPCTQFMPKMSDDTVSGDKMDETERRLMACMQKAITVIQFKLEGQIIQRRPHYKMDDRLLLDKIDFKRGALVIGEHQYELIDTLFPTINPDDPYTLTEREQALVERLIFLFQNSEKLQAHTRFLFSKGSMYLIHNGNLLYHGCIALDEEGEFAGFTVDGQAYKARDFMDRVERLARQGYFASDPDIRQYGQDAMWYLWSGPQSPLFGKDKMATFERYFVKDESTHAELMNPYYSRRDSPGMAEKILREFGLNPQEARIINGHVPVKVKKEESPIKADGKLLVIDGGFAKAYQEKTGIAGYTLIGNSYGFLLASHQPFESTQKAIQDEMDIDSPTEILETNYNRIRVKDTDLGRDIQQRIEELQMLLNAYRDGLIKENN